MQPHPTPLRSSQFRSHPQKKRSNRLGRTGQQRSKPKPAIVLFERLAWPKSGQWWSNQEGVNESFCRLTNCLPFTRRVDRKCLPQNQAVSDRAAFFTRAQHRRQI